MITRLKFAYQIGLLYQTLMYTFADILNMNAHDAISTTMVYQLKCRREKFVGQTEWELRAARGFDATYTVTSARPFHYT